MKENYEVKIFVKMPDELKKYEDIEFMFPLN
jgi:hypothetical protein